MQGSIAKAFSYFGEGASTIFKPGYRRFIVVPLLVNILIFVAATFYLIQSFQDFLAYTLAFLPTWLQWLRWLIGPLVGVFFLVIYGYCFTVITNFIAAPFFGLLAAKIEAELTGKIAEDEPLLHMIPRTLARELTKLWYFLSRGVLVLLVFLALILLPGLNILGTCLAALWGCWCLSIQYTDYAADNHQTGFSELRNQLGKQRLTSLGFGGIVLFVSMIPLVNILIPPIAVAGATILWVREISKTHTAK